MGTRRENVRRTCTVIKEDEATIENKKTSPFRGAIRTGPEQEEYIIGMRKKCGRYIMKMMVSKINNNTHGKKNSEIYLRFFAENEYHLCRRAVGCGLLRAMSSHIYS